jgi:glycosyltransferase involved in cell wall biosynthesis
MMGRGQVSVCIPVYNASKYLPACVKSVLQQTRSPVEIIILDDASSDHSSDVARRLARLDVRIKVLSKEHTALGDTRNQLIRASTSEIVACLDADDIAEPDRLVKQVAFMDTHPKCVGLGGHVQLMDEFGHKFYFQPKQPLEPAAIESELLRGRASAISQTTFMLRRSAFDRIGGYDPSLNCSEDMEFYLRLCEIGELWNLPDILVRMRRYPGSISGISKRGEAEERRERLTALACVRRGIDRLPLMEFRTEPMSRYEWYERAARGYLDNASLRMALIHCWLAFLEAPRRREVWHTVFQILKAAVK